MKNYTYLLLVLLFIALPSCEKKDTEVTSDLSIEDQQNEEAFMTVLQKHLNAVTNRDLAVLKSTMSPNGNMELALPGTEIIYSADGFLKYHEDWFAEPNWTFGTKVVSVDIGIKYGAATVEILYEEPDRNGKPYFNRMVVTYTLEKIDGKWYIIKDHASSIEKTQPPEVVD